MRLVKQKYTVVTAGVSSEVMESMFKSYEGEAKDYASKLLKAWIPVLSNKEQVKWVAKRLRAFCDRKFFKKENPLADDYVALYDLFGKFRDTKKDAEESKFKTLKALKFAPDATPEEAVNAIKQAFNLVTPGIGQAPGGQQVQRLVEMLGVGAGVNQLF